MIEKRDKRLLDSAINATNMDGQVSKITVTLMVNEVNYFGNPE